MSMRSTRGNFGAIYMRHYENAWARRSGRRNNRSLFVLFELRLSLRRLVCCRHGRGDASHAANLSLVELFSRSLHVLYSCTLHIGWVPRRKRFKWKKKTPIFFLLFRDFFVALVTCGMGAQSAEQTTRENIAYEKYADKDPATGATPTIMSVWFQRL